MNTIKMLIVALFCTVAVMASAEAAPQVGTWSNDPIIDVINDDGSGDSITIAIGRCQVNCGSPPVPNCQDLKNAKCNGPNPCKGVVEVNDQGDYMGACKCGGPTGAKTCNPIPPEEENEDVIVPLGPKLYDNDNPNNGPTVLGPEQIKKMVDDVNAKAKQGVKGTQGGNNGGKHGKGKGKGKRGSP